MSYIPELLCEESHIVNVWSVDLEDSERKDKSLHKHSQISIRSGGGIYSPDIIDLGPETARQQ